MKFEDRRSKWGAAGEVEMQPADTEEIERCPTCRAERTGRYCARCGERRLGPGEHSLVRFIREAAAEVFDLDAKVYRSFLLLARRPGHLTREFLRGRRVPYLRPLQMFLLANLAYFIVQPYTGYTTYNTPLAFQMERQPYSDALNIEEVVRDRVARSDATFESFEAAFDARSEIYAKTLVFVMIPIFTLVLGLAFFYKRRGWLEHLVFAVHYYAFELFYVGTVFLLIWSFVLGQLTGVVRALRAAAAEGHTGAAVLDHLMTESPTIVLILPYLYFAMRRVYGTGRWASVGLAIALQLALVVILILYRLILFWVTLLGGKVGL